HQNKNLTQSGVFILVELDAGTARDGVNPWR
ncbi:MAG: hypothetical protein JWP13_825, partial [Candidatus Saccharibacteria bacterium]|nr:hypothetical protein [Candidatus Saccharibacteria bacterium]